MSVSPRFGPLVQRAVDTGTARQVLVLHRRSHGLHYHAGIVVNENAGVLRNQVVVAVPGNRGYANPSSEDLRQAGRWLDLVTVSKKDAVPLDPPDASLDRLMKTIADDYRQTKVVHIFSNPEIVK